jgi:acyl-CoA synthetase (AMP-forming)/AMP-acid ligase II
MSPSASAFIEVKPVTGAREEISWAQFEDRTNRLARGFVDKGVQKGDKVFLLGKNSLRWLEAYFAILKTGAWAVPLNFRFTDRDIGYCARVAEPVVFIFDHEYRERMDVLRKELPTVEHYVSLGMEGAGPMESLEDIIEEASSSAVNVPLSDEDECALYFTSGTTGTPKPVLLRQKNLMGVAITEASNHNFVDSDRFLMMPPLYHLAIGHLLGTLVAGACSVLLTEQISPRYIVETIARERVSAVFLLVPWAADLLDALDRKQIRLEEHDLDCWRQVFMGAQPIPASLVQRLKGYFPEMEYETTYGLSESSGPGAIHLGIGNERKAGAIGKPGLLWDARIVDETGKDVRRGEVGEVILRGAGVMKEYYKNPQLTAQAIRDGWLYTGDLGKSDEEGFIYLVDRKKDLVISGGENVYPVEVEDVIRRHEKVHDVAVIGTPDERLGEIVTAVIQPKGGEALDEEEINRFCERQLPRYKRPRRIIFGEVLRNPAGKIEKPRLRELYRRSK